MSLVVGLLTAGASEASTFTSFSPPLSGASDYATDFPVFGGAHGLGPAGLLNDGSHFFATDPFQNQTLYRFPESEHRSHRVDR